MFFLLLLHALLFVLTVDVSCIVGLMCVLCFSVLFHLLSIVGLLFHLYVYCFHVRVCL